MEQRNSILLLQARRLRSCTMTICYRSKYILIFANIFLLQQMIKMIIFCFPNFKLFHTEKDDNQFIKIINFCQHLNLRIYKAEVKHHFLQIIIDVHGMKLFPPKVR
jgi:hypothetical protein